MVVNLLTYLNVLTHCSTTPSACRASPICRRSSSGPSASRRPSSASLTPTPIPHPNPNPDPNPNPNPNVGQARLQPRLVGAGRGAARSPLRLVQGASRVGGRSRARRRLLLCTLAHRPRGGRAERRRADVRLAPIHHQATSPYTPYTPYTSHAPTPLTHTLPTRPLTGVARSSSPPSSRTQCSLPSSAPSRSCSGLPSSLALRSTRPSYATRGSNLRSNRLKNPD